MKKLINCLATVLISAFFFSGAVFAQRQKPIKHGPNKCCFLNLTASINSPQGQETTLRHSYPRYSLHCASDNPNATIYAVVYGKGPAPGVYGRLMGSGPFRITNGYPFHLMDRSTSGAIIDHYPIGEYLLKVYVDCCPESPVSIYFKVQ